MFSVVKTCQNCSSFVLIPNNRLEIKLEELNDELEGKMFKKRAYTGTVLSVEKKCKINIYKSGKIVVFTNNDELVNEMKEELSSILYEVMNSD